MNELKPCPFCGGKAELIIAPGYFKQGLSSSGWLVKCTNGCCNQMPHVSDHDAVEAWNKRAESCNNLQSKLQQLATIPRHYENDPNHIADDDKMVDMISRKEAIDIVVFECDKWTGLAKEISKQLKQLPSAQSDVNPIEYAALNYRIGHKEGYEQGKADARQEPLRINLNELIKVKLTDLGKKIYYHRFDELNKTYGREIIKPSFPKEDENGYTMFQLWEFIQLYGAHFGMGAPSVVDPLEIVFAREKLL